MNRTLIQVGVVVLLLWMIAACHPYKYLALGVESEELKGPVKKVTVIYPAVTEYVDTGVMYFRFNEEYARKREFMYFDTNGFVILHNPRYNTISCLENVFDKKGRPIKCYEYVSGKLFRIHSIEYNFLGSMKWYITYSKDLEIDFGTVCRYDHRGRLIENIQLSNAGTIVARLNYFYDKKDCIKTVLTHGSSTDDSTYNTTYLDRKNNVKIISSYYGDTLYNFSIDYLNDEGKIARSVFYDHDSVWTSTFINEYNNSGDILKEITIEPGPVKTVYQYKYDEFGNWISKTEIGKTTPTVFRRIEYY